MNGWTLLVATHAAAAITCLMLGGYQLARRVKGDVSHRVTGWVWVLGMLFVASSSFAIRDLRDGRFSLLHVLSAVTLVTVTLGVVSARRGNIAAHKANMRGSWFGLAGAFVGAVAVPRREIPTFVVAEPLGAIAALAALVGLTVGVVALSHAVDRAAARRPRRTPEPAEGVTYG